MGMSNGAEAYNKTREFSPANTKEYWKNRAQENYGLLKSKNPNLAQAYANVIKDHYNLAAIKLTDMDIKQNAHFNSCGQQDGQFYPEVAFNLSNMETYTEPGMDILLKQVSIQLGARYEDIKNDQELVSTFILLHEFGHGADFIDNYLKPDENRDKPLSEVLKGAVKANRQSRLKDEMTMPIPGHVKLESREDRKKYRKRLEAFGIEPDTDGHISRQQVNTAQDISYREMSSEAKADYFARNYIMKHRDEFFLPVGAKDDGSGRIKTGEKIPMDEEEIILSGIRDGKNITLTKIAQTGKSDIPVGYKRSGFVIGQIGQMRGINLVQDITDDSRTMTSNIISVERQLLPNGKNTFTAKTISGATYEITQNPNIRPNPVHSSVEEMNSALGLSAGSEAMLMKRDIKSGSASGVIVGAVMDGKLRHTPRDGSDITLLGPNGGSTTEIKEVRRVWRTWLFKTSSGSIYEITPET